MRTVQTNRLTGKYLDYAVALAKGYDVAVSVDMVMMNLTPYCPSTNWLQGGEIIEEEKISIEFTSFVNEPWLSDIAANNSGDFLAEFGDTPLIAAMRCFVGSKLGEKIEIPDAFCY